MKLTFFVTFCPRVRGLISNKLHSGIKVDRWSNDPKYTRHDITPLITTIPVVTSPSQRGREAAFAQGAQFLASTTSSPSVCSFLRNRFTSKCRCVSAATGVTCACATHARIHFASVHQDKTSLQPVNKWPYKDVVRDTTAAARVFWICVAVARIFARIYAYAYASRTCVSRSESQRALPAAARAQSVASEWDYLCQKLPEINFMHLRIIAKINLDKEILIGGGFWINQITLTGIINLYVQFITRNFHIITIRQDISQMKINMMKDRYNYLKIYYLILRYRVHVTKTFEVWKSLTLIQNCIS